MAEITKVRREVIEKDLYELEVSYGMPTRQFVAAFRNGRLNETPDFRRWAHLSAALGLFERREQKA
jgi:hypothetical protein